MSGLLAVASYRVLASGFSFGRDFRGAWTMLMERPVYNHPAHARNSLRDSFTYDRRTIEGQNFHHDRLNPALRIRHWPGVGGRENT